MSQASEATVSNLTLRGLFAAANRLSPRIVNALQTHGLSPAALSDSDRRVPKSVFEQLIKDAAKSGGDCDLGLHLAEQVQPGDFAVFDYLVGNSPTLGGCYTQFSRYLRLLHDGINMVVERDKQIARIWYREQTASSRGCTDWVVAGWLIGGRQAIGERFAPTHTSFQHAAPADLSEYHRIFSCPLTFGAARNEITLNVDLLDRPVLGADPALLELIRDHGEKLLADVQRSDGALAQVERVVAELLASGEVTTETISKRLGMSARTLRRRLAAEGSSFQTVFDETRCKLAKGFLADPSIAVAEVAFPGRLLRTQRVQPRVQALDRYDSRGLPRWHSE